MKKTIATILVLGALISGTTIYANGITTMPSEKPGKVTRVTFENVNKGARLLLKDSNGQILYSERISKEGSYTKNYDLSEFPVGDYSFEIDKKGFISIYPISVQKESVEMLSAQNLRIAKPSVSVNDNRAYLTRLGTESQTIDVSIYFEGQDLAFSEEITREGEVERIYDFSTSESGSYLFSIDADNRTFNETVYINGVY